MSRPRFNLLLLSSFAAVGLLLAAIGIYGVISYSVGQRTQEIGLRMALGALPRDIRRSVVGEAVLLAGIGLAAGVAGALVLTRVISKPSSKILCLDLGHKAIASESPHPRVELMGLADARAIGHSEEHLTIETDRADEFPVGTPLYGIPWHICPTVALHQEAVVVRDGRAMERWQVVARARTITV